MSLKLKPSARIKKRYLLIEATSKEEIEKAILDGIGILGWAKAAPFFVNLFKNKEKFKDKFILAINRKEIDSVRASFELSQDKIKILRVSGTLKGLGR
ncbi:hypothetical protein HYV50_01920 [Candidatus Pacearchaeota archaeon]|nr:hypothetical protein [Candidatus Pacearchaeota archaeon]